MPILHARRARLEPLVSATLILSLSACLPKKVGGNDLQSSTTAAPQFVAGAAGPFATFEQDYQMPPAVNPLILTDRMTEIWGRLYMPSTQSAAKGPFPLLVFLHGNHATCGHGTNPRIDDQTAYSSTGTCPAGYVVTPNHRGYDYLARNMASWGYVVISINANRGINTSAGVDGDDGLNLARGRLVLSHLAQLAKWNTSGGSLGSVGIDLTGKVDFSRIGMMGHSRGGEGVRAAYAQYNDPGSQWPAILGPIGIKGIFEIAPVDGQTSRSLDAMNIAWNVVVGLCDGDVSDFQGVRPFDRMLRQNQETNLTPKSTLFVWGANHNFFNTEWQTSDAQGCDDHQPIFDPNASQSQAQQQIALVALSAFFQAHVGGTTANALSYFDPINSLPSSLLSLTSYGRDFIATPDKSETLHLLDIASTDSLAVGDNGTNSSANLQPMPYDDGRGGIAITWDATTGPAFYTVAFTAPTNLGNSSTLDLDLESLALGQNQDFSIALVSASGSSSSVHLSQFQKIRGATGRDLFQTARIPLAAFSSLPKGPVTGVSFVFDESPKGSFILGGIRATTTPPKAIQLVTSGVQNPSPSTSKAFVGSGQVTDASLSQASGAQGPNGQPQQAYIALTVQSPSNFPARSALPVLHLHGKTYTQSYYAGSTLDSLVFRIPVADFTAIQVGDQVTVSYGALTTSTYIINAGAITQDVLDGVQ